MDPAKRSDLVAAIVGMDEEAVAVLVEQWLSEGVAPAFIIDVCRGAMSEVGARFEAGEAFIPELIMAGEIMRQVSLRLKPHLLTGVPHKSLSSVVFGTVKGDVHDIGKDIVVTILDAAGFDVEDLGVDVPPERFVAAVRERAAGIVGLSCLLTTGFDSMKATVEAIESAGLRGQTRVMIGGAPITARVCAYVAADGWGSDAAAALTIAQRWAGEAER